MCGGMLRVNHQLPFSDNFDRNKRDRSSKSCKMGWVKNFQETGSVMDLPRSRQTKETKETIDNVHAAF